MKRSSLRRYTGLRSSKPLRASTALRRTGRIAGGRKTAEKRPQPRRRASSSDWSAEVRDLLWWRSGGRCEKCGGRDAVHAHHRLLRRHGDHRIVNALHLCAECHTEVHAKPRRSYDNGGWLVRAGHDPKTVRVLLWCGWVLLDDDGTYQQEGQ